MQFVNVVKGGNVPKEFIPAVEKGFKDCLGNGVLGGFPLTGLKVTLTDGSFHPVDSDQLSFELVAHQAFKALRTITSGRATSSMEYDHHSPVSSTLAKEILDELKGNSDLVK